MSPRTVVHPHQNPVDKLRSSGEVTSHTVVDWAGALLGPPIARIAHNKIKTIVRIFIGFAFSLVGTVKLA
jgi:hypothetical protein